MDYGVFVFGVCVFVPVGICMWYMMKQSDALYDGLNEIHNRAKSAVNLVELRQIYAELREFSNKNCWHKHHLTRVKEIKSFIDGRIAEFKTAVEIVVELQSEGWLAHIKNEKEMLGRGFTASAALGDLIRCRPDKFNVNIQIIEAPLEKEMKNA